MKPNYVWHGSWMHMPHPVHECFVPWRPVWEGNRFSPANVPQLVRDNLAFFFLTHPRSDVATAGLFLSDTGFLAALANTTTILSLARFPFSFGLPFLLNPWRPLMSWYPWINAVYSIWGRFFSGAIIAQQSRVEEKQEERAVARTARSFSLLHQKTHIEQY